MVRGRLARNGDQVIGELLPAYQLDGLEPLAAEPSEFAVVLRSQSGQELGRFPFDPEWRLHVHGDPDEPPPPEPEPRSVMSFSQLVPALAGVHVIDLMGPTGLLDTIEYSANAPQVEFVGPGSTVPPGTDSVSAQWSGHDQDGDSLLYSVYYSSDGGEVWQLQSFEQTGTSLEVPLRADIARHMIKVIATDGVRSGESVTEFTVSAQVGATATAVPVSTPQATSSPVSETGGGCAAPVRGSAKRNVAPYMLAGLVGLLLVGRRRKG